MESSTLKTVEKEIVLSNLDDITSSSSSAEGKDRPQSQDSKPTGFTQAPEVQDEAHADLKRQTGDTSLYKYYFQSVGWKLTAIFFAANILCAGIWRMPQVWLKVWTDHGTNNDTALYFGIYVGWAVIGAIGGFALFGYVYPSLPKNAQLTLVASFILSSSPSPRSICIS